MPLYHDRRPGKDGAPGYPFATNQQQILFWLSIYLEPALERWKIDTDLRKAHFIAQARAESFDFTTTTEFGANFQQNDGTSYENRSDLGNTRPGDGARFIGRGIIQTTGRANYRDLSRKLSLNAVPDTNSGIRYFALLQRRLLWVFGSP